MTTLNQIRKKIEKIDAVIIKKLAERQHLSKQIGILKAKSGQKITDSNREQDLMQYYENLCEQYNLQFPLVKRLFKLIISYSRKIQQ